MAETPLEIINAWQKDHWRDMVCHGLTQAMADDLMARLAEIAQKPEYGREPDYHGCQCHRCMDAAGFEHPFRWPSNVHGFIVCPICGNKRCPHASNHELPCTNSNERGQLGSIYL